MTGQPTIIHTPANQVMEGDTYVTFNNGWHYAAITGRSFTDTTITIYIQDGGRSDVTHPIASWRPNNGQPAPLVPILVEPTHFSPIPFGAHQ